MRTDDPKCNIHMQQPSDLDYLLFIEEEMGSETGEDLSKAPQQVSDSSGHSDSRIRSHLVTVRYYKKIQGQDEELLALGTGRPELGSQPCNSPTVCL